MQHPQKRRLSILTKHLTTSSTKPTFPVMPINLSYKGPLHGITILDLSQMVAGPAASQLLGDQGAEIIKVESLSGSAERGSSKAHILSPLFSVVNRSKRSISIDLKQPAGYQAFLKLVKHADVIVSNFRPGIMEKLHLSYDTLIAINPKLIYASISGFGTTGPYSQNRVYDPVIQSVAGLASIQQNENGRPKLMRLIVPDKVTALTAAQAITSALVQVNRTGKGCHIELSMLDAVLSFAWAEGFAQETFDPTETGTTPNYTYTRDLIFETKDNSYITAGAVQDKEWIGLVTALNQPEWLNDVRFQTKSNRNLYRNDRLNMMAKVIKTWNSHEILQRLAEYNVPSGIVNHPRTKVLEDPQVIANNLIKQFQHPWSPASMRQPRAAAQFSNETWNLRRFAPLLGEHTKEILMNIGNMNEKEIDLLYKNGVVKTVKGRVPEKRKIDGRKLAPTSG